MRSFVADLHHQLEDLCVRSNYNSQFDVYRGQCMSKEDFQKYSHNIGGLISFSSLLSCSEDKRIALAYAVSQNGNNNTASFTSDHSRSHVRNTAFANVTSANAFGDGEQEFLFSIGTVFRILWIRPLYLDSLIQEFILIVTNDEDKDLKDLREHMRQEICGTNNLINFDRLLIEMGNLNQSERFYNIVLRKTSAQGEPRTIAMIYNDLGFIAGQNNFK
ncbi:unnamed protein product [Rotaria sp. Silwood2]|nr:unnamed protein product [Rotaria sp. Silwood2]CAF4531245.1 unnamed protein product [Rotaria sp. Silwood2]